MKDETLRAGPSKKHSLLLRWLKVLIRADVITDLLCCPSQEFEDHPPAAALAMWKRVLCPEPDLVRWTVAECITSYTPLIHTCSPAV